VELLGPLVAPTDWRGTPVVQGTVVVVALRKKASVYMAVAEVVEVNPDWSAVVRLLDDNGPFRSPAVGDTIEFTSTFSLTVLGAPVV